MKKAMDAFFVAEIIGAIIHLINYFFHIENSKVSKAFYRININPFLTFITR